MSKRWTLGPLPEEPGDLFGVAAAQKRIAQLELALAHCVEQLNEALSDGGRPLDEDEKWDPESIIAHAVQDEEWRLQMEVDDA